MMLQGRRPARPLILRSYSPVGAGGRGMPVALHVGRARGSVDGQVGDARVLAAEGHFDRGAASPRGSACRGRRRPRGARSGSPMPIRS
jgi:hypothetical protein